MNCSALQLIAACRKVFLGAFLASAVCLPTSAGWCASGAGAVPEAADSRQALDIAAYKASASLKRITPDFKRLRRQRNSSADIARLLTEWVEFEKGVRVTVPRGALHLACLGVSIAMHIDRLGFGATWVDKCRADHPAMGRMAGYMRVYADMARQLHAGTDVHAFRLAFNASGPVPDGRGQPRARWWVEQEPQPASMGGSRRRNSRRSRATGSNGFGARWLTPTADAGGTLTVYLAEGRWRLRLVDETGRDFDANDWHHAQAASVLLQVFPTHTTVTPIRARVARQPAADSDTAWAYDPQSPIAFTLLSRTPQRAKQPAPVPPVPPTGTDDADDVGGDDSDSPPPPPPKKQVAEQAVPAKTLAPGANQAAGDKASAANKTFPIPADRVVVNPKHSRDTEYLVVGVLGGVLPAMAGGSAYLLTGAPPPPAWTGTTADRALLDVYRHAWFADGFGGQQMWLQFGAFGAGYAAGSWGSFEHPAWYVVGSVAQIGGLTLGAQWAMETVRAEGNDDRIGSGRSTLFARGGAGLLGGIGAATAANMQSTDQGRTVSWFLQFAAHMVSIGGMHLAYDANLTLAQRRFAPETAHARAVRDGEAISKRAVGFFLVGTGFATGISDGAFAWGNASKESLNLAMVIGGLSCVAGLGGGVALDRLAADGLGADSIRYDSVTMNANLTSVTAGLGGLGCGVFFASLKQRLL